MFPSLRTQGLEVQTLKPGLAQNECCTRAQQSAMGV